MRAFEMLVERHRRRSYSLAYQMTCTHENADHIIQETFVRAYCNRRRFDLDRPFANWLCRIAANLCLDRRLTIIHHTRCGLTRPLHCAARGPLIG